MSKITSIQIRMYTMGTGDCFALKFCSGEEVKLKMIIDVGVWSGTKNHLQPYVEDLLKYVENKVDILVVTHEHKDHVYGFDAFSELFAGKFETNEIWMGWTENDKLDKVKEWKKNYGQQKKALAIVADTLGKDVTTETYRKQFEGNLFGEDVLKARQNFARIVKDFADLHSSPDENNIYKGGLKGMDVAKNKIKKNKIKFFSPGDIIAKLKGIEGLNIYVFGPPVLYDDVSKETGGEGESYPHNDVLESTGAFGAAVLNLADPSMADSLLPFDDNYITAPSDNLEKEYNTHEWRKIDYDWMYGADSLALRVNSLTNNLSLAFAIEFEESGKVLLFPGDAEYGSWSSWHNINWKQKGKDGKTPLTEDLLRRVVFYKVAHHSSHNGTAKRLGMDMMTSKDLSAMITLDYNVIPSGWTKTMPNKELLEDLLAKTKGRLMILNEDGVYFDFHQKQPVSEKIEEAKQNMTEKEKQIFADSFKKEEYFVQYTVHI